MWLHPSQNCPGRGRCQWLQRLQQSKWLEWHHHGLHQSISLETHTCVSQVDVCDKPLNAVIRDTGQPYKGLMIISCPHQPNIWVIRCIPDSNWSSCTCTPPTNPPTPWIIPSIIQPPPPVALVNNPIPHSQPDPCWLVSWNPTLGTPGEFMVISQFVIGYLYKCICFFLVVDLYPNPCWLARWHPSPWNSKRVSD